MPKKYDSIDSIMTMLQTNPTISDLSQALKSLSEMHADGKINKYQHNSIKAFLEEKIWKLFSIPTDFITRYSAVGSDLPEYRNEFMRDRDRIMYCTAFKRLAGKTQIYTIGSDDHKKNRLTHSLEVAQIARTISRALGLNEDLAEAIALAHDLGHTPFGHAGEETLHKIMCPKSETVKDSPFYRTEASAIKKALEREGTSLPEVTSFESMFGFKHNIQSLRVAAVIEDSYRGEHGENIGLNLTNYTLWGILHHSRLNYKGEKQYPNYQDQFSEQIRIRGSNDAWSFEAYVVELADDIAQWHHDLEDAVRGNALPLEINCDMIICSFEDRLTMEEKKNIEKIKKYPNMDRKSIAELSHYVVNTLVNDLVHTSSDHFRDIEKELTSHYPDKTPEELSKELYSNYDSLNLSIAKDCVISLSKAIDTDVFRKTIKSSVHHSKDVERMNSKGEYIIKKLFEAYNTHPQQLTDGMILHFMVDIGKYESIECAKTKGMGSIRTEFEDVMVNPKMIYRCQLMRRICDHIASMTDRYAIEEYNNLYG